MSVCASERKEKEIKYFLVEFSCPHTIVKEEKKTIEVDGGETWTCRSSGGGSG